MGCLGQFILFFLVIPFIWNHVIAPIFQKEKPENTEDDFRRATGGHSPKEHYLMLLMPLLSKIAKADGRITEHEISGVEAIFSELHLTREECRFAQHCFNESKASPLRFEHYVSHFAQANYDFEVRLLTFKFLVRVAKSDGTLCERERQMLAYAGLHFGIPREFIIRLVNDPSARNTNQRSRHSNTYRTAPLGQREQDLQLLGLKKNATAEDIKKAYRQKVKELHPDRLQAQGLPESMLKEATERMAAINAAYDRLTK